MARSSGTAGTAPAPGGSCPDFSRYAPALRRYFRKRVLACEVDDLVQEVFLNMQARRAESRIDNVEGYLFSVAANVLIRHRAAMRRVEAGIGDSEAVFRADDCLCPERVLLGDEALRRVVSALQRLPVRTRDVLVMHRFEEMTYGVIAARLGISVSAVEKHIMLALKALKAEMERDR